MVFTLRTLTSTLALLLCAAALNMACGQSVGPFEGITWHEPANEADLLSHGIGIPALNYIDELVDERVQQAKNTPEGRRGLFPQSVARGIIKTGWVNDSGNPHDQIIAATLAEDISSEGRTSISVDPLNFDMSSGEKIWIQTGDPSIPAPDYLGPGEKIVPAYLTANASEGDTSLSIDDGNGNPVTISASSGDRVLSNTQGPWIKHGKRYAKDKWDQFLTLFSNQGGEADYVYLDFETSIPATSRMTKDPRWDTTEKTLDGKTLKQYVEDGPYTVNEVIDAGPGDPASNWNKSEFLGRILAKALNDAIYDKMQEYFPNSPGSDYSQPGITEQNKSWGTDGNLRWHNKTFGNHGSHPLYASIRGLSKSNKSLGLPYEIGDHPFIATLWQTRYIRAMHRSTGGKVMPWLTYEGLVDSFFNVDIEGTPYYEEHIRHMALHTDSEVPVLYWNARDGGGGGGNDQQDLNFNSVLSDLNNQISADSYTTTTTASLGWQDDLIATAIETENKKLWRITVRRILPSDSRDVVVNVSNGDIITIPGGEVGAWYETAKGATPTFSFSPPPIDNILPSDKWVDFSSSVWNGGGDIIGGQPDPDGGNDAWAIGTDPAFFSNTLTLSSGQYTFSVWAKSNGNTTSPQVRDSDGNVIERGVVIGSSNEFDNWRRTRISFTLGSETDVFFRFKGAFSDIFLYQPMLNEGKVEGAYTPPTAPSPGSQEISLQKGGNLVSTNVDPTYPDLEAVLGGATSSIARVVTQDDQVFDPSEGTDEIGTWDPTEAYSIYAEEPTSFVVGGTVLGSKDVSLDAGWNWLPHLGSTSVPVDQAFDTIQNDLVMVKDETGRVYRPAQDTDQIGSLQPGTAYKILLENPVVLSYPLE